MTDPTKRQREPESDAEHAPEVEVELVKDLDVPAHDEDGLRGGLMCSHTTMSLAK
jgi:hypothetical protein